MTVSQSELIKAWDDAALAAAHRVLLDARLGIKSGGSVTVAVAGKPGYYYVSMGVNGELGQTQAYDAVGVASVGWQQIRVRRENRELVIREAVHYGNGGGGGGSTTLDALTDVTTTGVTDGDLLSYDSATGQWIPFTPTGTTGGAPSPHALYSASAPDMHHSGFLHSDQAPQFLLTDGSRPLTGNLSVTPGIGIDGVDISNFKAAYDTHLLNEDAHHNRVSVGNLGLTLNPGQVLSLNLDDAAPGLEITATGVRIDLKPTSGLILDGVGLAVGGGDGIDVLTTTIAVDVTDIIDTAAGLKEDASNNIQVRLETNSGLTFGGAGGVTLGTPLVVSALTVNNVTGAGHGHAVTASTNVGNPIPGTEMLLKSTSGGALTLGPLTLYGNLGFAGGNRSITASNDLTLIPATDLHLTPTSDIFLTPGSGLVQLSATKEVRSVEYTDAVTGIDGFRLFDRGATTPNDYQLTITAMKLDELHARVFVADEVRIDRGEEYWSKSYGIVDTNFNLPAPGGFVNVIFENAPVVATANLFTVGDWLLIRGLDFSTGTPIFAVWFTVTALITAGSVDNKTQTWQLRHQSGGVAGLKIRKGLVALDAGVVGQGWVHLNAYKDGGGPYFQIGDMTAAPEGGTPTHTNRVRMGNLSGVAGITGTFWGVAAGNDLGTTPSNVSNPFSGFTAGKGIGSPGTDHDGLKLYNTDIELYTAGNLELSLSRTAGLQLLQDTATGSHDARYIAWHETLGAGAVADGPVRARLSSVGAGADHDLYIEVLGETTGLSLLELRAVGGGQESSLNLQSSPTFRRMFVNTGDLNITAAHTLISTESNALDPSLGVFRIWENSLATNLSAGMTIEQAGIGDAVLHFRAGGIWSLGVDNDDSDKFKISLGTDLLTNSYLTLTTDGTLIVANDLVTDGLSIAGSASVLGNFSVGRSDFEPWQSGHRAIQLGAAAAIMAQSTGSALYMTDNAYYDGTWRRKVAEQASLYTLNAGEHIFATASTGAAGSLITLWTPVLTLDAAGNANFGGAIAGTSLAMSGGGSFGGTLFPTTDIVYDLGTASLRWRALYVNELHAGTISGATLSGGEWEHPASMVIDANAATDTLLSVVNQGAGRVDLFVDRNITLGGTVDGVELSSFKTSYDTHAANTAIHHAPVTVGPGLLLATQLVTLDPNLAGAGLDLTAGVMSVDSTVARTTTTVTSGAGLSGAVQTLGANITLMVGQGDGILVAADTVAVDSSVIRNTYQILTPAAGGLQGGGPLAGASISLEVNLADSNPGLTKAATGLAVLLNETSHALGSGLELTSTGLHVDTSVVRSDRTIEAGTGLAGGGALSSNIILAVNASNGLTYAGDNVVVNQAYDFDWSGDHLFTGPFQVNTVAQFWNEINLVGPARTVFAEGQLTLLPGGDLILDPTGDDVLPGGSYRVDLGDYNRKWRTLFAAELYVETLVAQDVLATIGGRIMVAPTTTLIADCAAGSSTIDVKHNNLTNGSFVMLQTAPGGIAQFEVMKTTSTHSVIAGGYRYSVTRNLDGTGANAWVAGDAVVNLGRVVGEGYIDLTSTSTVHNHFGPTMTIYARTGTAAWTDTKPVVSLGNLSSFVDYGKSLSTPEFGLAVGNDLTKDQSNGFSGFTADRVKGLRLFNTELNIYDGANRIVMLNATEGLAFEADPNPLVADYRRWVVWYDDLTDLPPVTQPLGGMAVRRPAGTNINVLDLFAGAGGEATDSGRVEINASTIASTFRMELEHTSLNLYHNGNPTRYALYLTNTGKLGINVPDSTTPGSYPASPLHVFQSDAFVSTAAGVTIEQSGSGDAVLHLLRSGVGGLGVQRWVVGVDASDNHLKISTGPDAGSGTKLDIHPITGALIVSGAMAINGSLSGVTNLSMSGALAAGSLTTTGNAAIGTTDMQAWQSAHRAIQLGEAAALMAQSTGTALYMTDNGFYTGAWWRKVAEAASLYTLNAGTHTFSAAVTGAAGGAITWTPVLTLDAAGGAVFAGALSGISSITASGAGSFGSLSAASLTGLSSLTVSGNIASGAVLSGASLTITGGATFNGALSGITNLSASGTGSFSLLNASSLAILGAASFAGALTGITDLTMSGALTATGNIASGGVLSGATLTVTGAAGIGGALGMAVNADASVTIANETTSPLKFTHSGVAHGMTLLAPTNAYGKAAYWSGGTGGMQFRGMSDANAVAFGLIGTVGATATTQPAVVIQGTKKNVAGTSEQALAATEIVLDVLTTIGTPLVRVYGGGDVALSGHVSAGAPGQDAAQLNIGVAQVAGNMGIALYSTNAALVVPSINGHSGRTALGVAGGNTQAGDLLLHIGGVGRDSTAAYAQSGGFNHATGHMRIFATQAFTTAWRGTKLVFGVTPNDTATAQNVFEIEQNGRLISTKTYSLPQISSPDRPLFIDSGGNIGFYNLYNKPITTGNMSVWVDQNGKLGTTGSSRRFKENIEPLAPSSAYGPNLILALQPVTFTFKDDETATGQIGLIAEDVDELGAKALVAYDTDGLPAGLQYDRFIVPLILAVQQLMRRVEELERQPHRRLH